MVGSAGPAGAGASGDIGSIGSSGLNAFGIGGIAPNGGGPAPTGTGALGAAGLSPIGSTGLTAFGLGGPSEAAKLDRYDSLVQQNTAQLAANGQRNADLSQAAGAMKPPSFTAQPLDTAPFAPPPQHFAAPLPTPRPLPAFTGQPLAGGFTPPSPTTPAPTLPPEAGPAPAAPGIADLPAPLPPAPSTPSAMAPDALASPVTRPNIPAPTAEVDPFAPVGRGGLGLTPPAAPGVTAFGFSGPAPAPGAEAGLGPVTNGAASFRPLPPVLDGGPETAPAHPTGPESPQAPSPDFSAPAAGDELVFRSRYLPLGHTRNGDIVPAWPESLIEIGRAIAYPGRVLNGEAQVFDPATGRPTDEAFLNALTTAGLVGAGTGSFVTREAGEAVFGSGPVLRGVGPHGLNVTEGVAVTGARPINLGHAYEAGVREMYGNNAFRSRQFEVMVNGVPKSYVADNVALIGGKRTAVEAKLVDDWANSLRNPASPIGAQPWAIKEQQKMIEQARQYSVNFKGGAIYHTNSPELAAFYGQAFRDAGIKNIRFVLTPALRPGVL